MTHGAAPPPPFPPPPDPIPHYPGNEKTANISSNAYYSEDDHWIEPPEFTPPGPFDAEKHARHLANHSAYCAIGHSTIWKNYIYFGFYMYDDCQDFLKAWKTTVHDRLERHRLIWREYHYRRLHHLAVSPTLLTSSRTRKRCHISRSMIPTYGLRPIWNTRRSCFSKDKSWARLTKTPMNNGKKLAPNAATRKTHTKPQS
jgi:hypothetical protein